MAWEKRGDRRYYYRKRRQGNRVVSEFVGAGYLGSLAAQLDDADRLRQQAQREQVRRERATQDDLDKQVDGLGQQLADLVTAVLLVNGYHTHKRQWRRVRDNRD